MGLIGQLKTDKPIENAMREIKDWLNKIDVNGLNIDTRYDAKNNVALLRFSYIGKNYEFKSTKQKNCRLNMWAIARAMESKVRNHIMEIEPFQKSMQAYLQLEGSTDPSLYKEESASDATAYATIGISPLASNEELEKHYKNLAKSWHPDMAGSDEARKVFEQKFSEINTAWEKIKKERGL